MAQESGPLVNRKFTDAEWRWLFGDEPGIQGDVNGTSYALTLGTSSNIATLGSPSQDSISQVGGGYHRIAADQTQEIEIPEPASGVTRTDIIAVRYDPTYTTAPGPCRLYRIPGTGAALPAYDAGPPGAEDMPLYGITRIGGQALSQATVRDLRVRTGPNLLFRLASDIPSNIPLGTRARVQDGSEFVRALTAAGAPTWVNVTGQAKTYVDDTAEAVREYARGLRRWSQLFTASTTGAAFAAAGGGTLGVTQGFSTGAASYPRVINVDFGGLCSALADGAIATFILRRNGVDVRSARAFATRSASGSYRELLPTGQTASFQLVATLTGTGTVTNDPRFTYLHGDAAPAGA